MSRDRIDPDVLDELVIHDTAIAAVDGKADANTVATQDNATQIGQLAARVEVLESTEPPIEPPVEPPVGDWWETQLAEALTLRDVARGPRGTPTVLAPSVNVVGLMSDIQITAVHAGRSVQMAPGSELAWSEIRNGGNVDLQDTTQRNQMVGTPWPSGAQIIHDSIITDSQWTGTSGNDGLILRCELARNTLSGASYTFGIAEASSAKFWNSAAMFVEDSWVHDQQSAGVWWDGSGTTGGGVRGGLFERCGAWCVYLELGGGTVITGATFLDTPVAMRIQTDGALIRQVVTVGCSRALYALNENRSDRKGRPVTVDVAESFFDLTATPTGTHGYGWADFGGPGPTRFISDRNTFRVDPSKRVFRAGSGMLTFSEWQASGHDQNSVLI